MLSAPPCETLRALVNDIYLPQNLRIRSNSTRKHYAILLRQFDEFLGRESLLSDLTDATVAGFAHWLDDGTRRAVTVNQRLHYLLAIATWCARRGMGGWLTIQKLPEPQRTPRAWTRPQLESLIAACRLQIGFYCGVPRNLWWQSLHAVFWNTGERTAATLGLKWEWIDMPSGVLEIPAEARKGRCKGMLYSLKPATVELLAAIRLPKRTDVFPFPGCVGTFYNHYSKLLASAGLPTDRRSKPQRMRRSFASHLEAAGENATEALQHTARRVTVESYLDQSIIQRVPANQCLFDL